VRAGTRIQRFRNASDLKIIGEDDLVPLSGWAFVTGGPVYKDGKQIGVFSSYRHDETQGRRDPYTELEYFPLDVA
jgi:hypothetical protein